MRETSSAEALPTSSSLSLASLLNMASALGRFGAWAYELAENKVIWSDEVAIIHGLPPGQVPDLESAFNYYHPDCRERLAQSFARCLTDGTPFDEELVLLTAEGREVHVRSMGSAVRDEQGQIIRLEGAFQDISEQFERQRRLIESEATLSAIFSQSYVFQGVVDLDGTLLDVNDIAVSGCGYTREQVLGRKFWEGGWWNQDPALAAQIKQIVSRVLAGETVVAEMDYHIASGERRQTAFSAVPIRRPDGRVVKVLANGVDITHRKQDEVFLLTQRELLAAVASGQPLQALLLDTIQLVEKRFPGKQCSIMLLSADGHYLGQGYSLRLPAAFVQQLEGLPIGPSAGSCGTAAFERRTVIVSDVHTDPLWADYLDLADEYDLSSCWSMPIYSIGGQILGTFAIYADKVSSPGPGELDLIANCTRIAGIAIERSRTENQLKLLETCIANLNDVVMITEASPLREPGPRMLFVNDAFVRQTGYAREEVIGRSPRLLQGPRTQRAELDRVGAAVSKGEPVRAELINYRKDGTEYWVELDIVPIHDRAGQLTHYVAIERDISERKHSEIALRESRERFHHVARATNDAIWDWDVQTDAMWWSDGIERLFGLSRTEIEPTSESWTRRIHPDDLPHINASIQNFITHGGEDDVWIAEYRFRKHDGSYVDVHDRGFVVRDDQGKGIRMLGGMIDVSAQKRAETEARRLNRALKMLSSCNEKLIRSTDEATLLSEICELCVSSGGYRMAWVGYAQHDEAKSVIPVGSFGELTHLARSSLSWSADKPNGRGPAGTSIRTGKAVVIGDIREDPDFAPWRDSAVELGYLSVVCLPLINGSASFGMLGLYAGEPRNISPDELMLLQEMADDLAFGIMNIRTRREQQRLQAAVLKIATSVSARSDTGFFQQLVLSMGETLEAPVGVIALLNSEQQLFAEPICTVVDGQAIASSAFLIDQTPCRGSLGTEGSLVSVDLPLLYPQATRFIELGAQAYVGQPLLSSSGRQLGLIFVLYRTPLQETDFVVSTLKIFAARAAAELERLQSDAQLREQASLLDKAHDAILVRDLDHRILFWNKGAERLYGWSAAEAIGQRVDHLLYSDPRAFDEATRKVMGQSEWVGEIEQLDRHGHSISIEGHWTLVHDDAGRPKSILAINTDIRQRKAAEREIYTLAFHDSLTGLPNRQLLLNRLNQALAESPRSGENSAIMFIDLDNFKTLNDTQGHDVGDQLLIQVAARLNHCVRESDTVARIGGDEFVVMLRNLDSSRPEAAAQAQAVADKILHAFSPPFDLRGYEYETTPSIGIALFNDNLITVEELLKRADLAMYQAKAAGRNEVCFYDPEMQAAVSLRLAMEKDLRGGLQRGEFILYYQAQIGADDCLTGAEVLLRWHHPKHGLMPPHSFIPVAEDSGLIIPLGLWILDAACRQLAAWAAEPSREGLTLAVNVSARQFRHPEFVAQVRNALEKNAANPKRLKLELTESQLVDNIEEVIDKMQVLRNLGVSISLDDFGTGYSSLSYLKRLPLSQLKIDPSFVRDILNDMNDAAIARTVITLGQSLGLEVIAEGVETVEQKALLYSFGCHHYQGYLFSRPVPIEQFEQLVFPLPEMGTH